MKSAQWGKEPHCGFSNKIEKKRIKNKKYVFHVGRKVTTILIFAFLCSRDTVLTLPKHCTSITRPPVTCVQGMGYRQRLTDEQQGQIKAWAADNHS
jgi:hypothetical protein